jgi:hypothetical protein
MIERILAILTSRLWSLKAGSARVVSTFWTSTSTACLGEAASAAGGRASASMRVTGTIQWILVERINSLPFFLPFGLFRQCDAGLQLFRCSG